MGAGHGCMRGGATDVVPMPREVEAQDLSSKNLKKRAAKTVGTPLPVTPAMEKGKQAVDFNTRNSDQSVICSTRNGSETPQSNDGASTSGTTNLDDSDPSSFVGVNAAYVPLDPTDPDSFLVPTWSLRCMTDRQSKISPEQRRIRQLQLKSSSPTKLQEDANKKIVENQRMLKELHGSPLKRGTNSATSSPHQRSLDTRNFNPPGDYASGSEAGSSCNSPAVAMGSTTYLHGPAGVAPLNGSLLHHSGVLSKMAGPPGQKRWQHQDSSTERKSEHHLLLQEAGK